jgi:hypothetical protein
MVRTGEAEFSVIHLVYSRRTTKYEHVDKMNTWTLL